MMSRAIAATSEPYLNIVGMIDGIWISELYLDSLRHCTHLTMEGRNCPIKPAIQSCIRKQDDEHMRLIFSLFSTALLLRTDGDAA